MTQALKRPQLSPIRIQRIIDFIKMKIVRISFLIILQGISWYTTVAGANVIFQNMDPLLFLDKTISLGTVFGTGIQAILLWLFLAGESIIKPRQKLYALIIAYTAVSIYASFFFTYQGISQESINLNVDFKHRIELLGGLIEQNKNYREAKVEVAKFESEHDRLTKESKFHRDGAFRHLYEDRIREIQVELTALEKAFNSKPYQEVRDDTQQVLDEIEDTLNTQPAEKSGAQSDEKEDISEALIKKLPSMVHDQVKSQFEIEDERLRKERSGEFLLPVKRLLSLNSAAIIALFLASIADLTSFLLGTAEFKPLTEKEKEEGRKQFENFFVNPVKSVCLFIPNFIESVSHFIFVLIRSLGELVNGLISGIISARKRALQSFVYTPNKIGIGKDSDKRQFFLNFRSAIFYKLHQQQEVAYLNFEQLISDCGNNFILIDACHKTVLSLVEIGWIKRIESEREDFSNFKEECLDDYRKTLYKIEQGYRDNLFDWLNLEERSMCQQRDLDSPSGGYTNLVFLPSHYAQNNPKKARHYARRFGWAVDRLFT